MLHIGGSVYKLFLYIVLGVLLYVRPGGSEKQHIGGSVSVVSVYCFRCFAVRGTRCFKEASYRGQCL